MEWAFVEREVPGLGGSAAEAFAGPDSSEDLPPRQKALAEGLVESVVGGFEVLKHEGRRALLRDLVTGRKHRVREHSDAIGYQPGEVGLGRLIPGQGRTWLRSPGMAFLGSHEPGMSSALVEGFQAAVREGVSPAIMVEGVLTAMISDDEVPRELRPALTRKLAGELATRTVELLEEAGLAEPVPDGPEDPEFELRARRAGVEGRVHSLRLYVDDPTADWLGALHAQSRGRL